ncbi:MAG: hypothetical protein RMJ16_08775 [Thermoguttaceae bacterium]|nr:hypothetical protein [Thermoguttaceae bacterium]
MGPGESLVRMPPHPLRGVAVRRVGPQVVQPDLAAQPGQVGLYRPALVEPSVVADDMDHSVMPQRLPQALRVSDE